MSVKSAVGGFFSNILVKPFVIKPGMGLPKDAVRQVTVEGGVGADHFVEKYTHRPGVGTTSASGRVLDMTPKVPGGLKPGDIVLRGNSAFTTAESGWFASITESWRKRDLHIHKSAVSHVAVVVRDRSGELRIVQMVSGATPPELAAKLKPWQKLLKATFLRSDSVSDFFNSPGVPYTSAIVMRPKDPQVALDGAAGALQLLDSQVTPSGATRPWYSKIPHSWVPGGRGGVCSTFVDKAFGGAFEQALVIPTTPEHFVISPLLEKVGETLVTEQTL